MEKRVFIIFCSDHSVLGSRSTINKQTINNLAVELELAHIMPFY